MSDLVDYLRARLKAEDGDCVHSDRADVTTMNDRDRRLLCVACGYEWMEARE